MNILFLDLGTRTGFCAGTKQQYISGVYDLRPGRFESPSMRLVKLLKALDEIRETMKIEYVYYEEVRRHKGVDAAHWYGAFWGHIVAWCDRHGIPYEGVPVGEIKKSFTGKGNASKEMMIEEANRRGFVTDDHNEADAIAGFLLKAEDE